MRVTRRILVCAAFGLVMLVAPVATARQGAVSASVYFRDVKIMVNGMDVKSDAEPFIFEGRTYVPIRAVAEALGAQVRWNDESSRVEITGHLSVVNAAASASRSGLGSMVDRTRITGTVVNGTNKVAKGVTVSCRAINAQGATVANGIVALQEDVHPGAGLSFQIVTDYVNERKLVAECAAAYKILE